MPNVNINTGGGGGIYNPLPDDSPVATTQAPIKPEGAFAKDQIVSANPVGAQQALLVQKPYVAPPDRPTLSSPNNPDSVYKTNPDTGKPQLNIPVTSKPILSVSNQQDGAFATGLNNLLDEATQSQGLSEEDAALVRFAYYHPDSEIVPQNLKDLAKDLIQKATDQVREQFNDPDFEPKPDVTSFDNNINDLYQSDFNAALKNYAEENGLSDEDVARLIFAQNHPETPVDPKDAAVLKELNAQVVQDLSQEYGLPSTLEFKPDTEFFDAQISQNLEANFDALLSTYSDENGLSSKDAATVKFAFMHPEADIPVSDSGLDYKALAADLSAKATAQTVKADGLPEGYSPTPPTKTFDQIVTGGFIFAARDAVTDPAQGLSKEDQETVFQLVTGQISMDDPSVPDALKDSARAVKKKALQKVMAQFGIPQGQFEPDPNNMKNASINTPKNLQIQTGTVKLAGGMVGGFKTVLKEMPNGSEKAVYADYLKAIGDALANLREVLYAIEQKDSSLSKEMSNWSTQSAQNKNDLNNAQRNKNLEKMRKAAKGKGGPLGALMKFFKKLGPIIGAMMATAMLGPVGLALSVLDTKLQIFAKMNSLFADGLAKMAKSAGASDKVAERMKIVGKVMFISTFFVAMGPTGGSAFMTFGPQMISESGVVKDIAVSAGAKPELAGQIGMYVTMAVGAAIALAMMIVPIPGPQVAALAKGAIDALRTVADALVDVATIVAQTLQKMVKFLADKMSSVMSLESQLGQVASMANDAIKTIIDNMKSLIGTLSKTVGYPNEALQAFSSTFDDAINGASKLGKNIKDSLGAPGDVAMNFLDNVGHHLSSSIKNPITIASTFETASGVEQAVNNLKLAAMKRAQAKLEELIGVLEGAIELLTSFLKNLRQVLDKLMAGLPETAQQVASTNEQVVTLYGDAGASQSRLLSA